MAEGCKQCEQYMKRMNILTSDFEFEIKKIQQDKSTEKALYEIHLQKQIRKWQQLYHQEKAARQQENHQWLIKYDDLINKHAQQLNTLQNQSQTILASTTTRLIQQHSQKYDQMMNQQLTNLKSTKQQNQKTLQTLKQNHQNEVQEIVKKNNQILENLKKSHQTVLELRCKQYEGIIVGKQSEMKTQRNLHDKTKREAKQAQNKLYEEIFQRKKIIIDHEAKINTLSETIVQKNKEIVQGSRKYSQLQEQSQNNLREKQLAFENRILQIEKVAEEKIKMIYEDSLTSCQKYKEALNSIEEVRENQKELYLNNIEQIQQSIENRASRNEDVEEIQNLKCHLLKKTKQCEALSEELKYYRLELQNKEQTYNKIFVPISGVMNENSNAMVSKRKQFKLRRAGKSVTTVRQILQSVNSGNTLNDRKPILYQKSKVL